MNSKQDLSPRTVDVDAAREAFERALADHSQTFGQFFLLRLLGAHVDYTEDTCVVTLEVKDFMFNPQGRLHGGVTALLLDVAMGHLLARDCGAGVTLELKVQYMEAVGLGPVRAQARFLRRGKSVCFLEGQLLDGADRLLAASTATFKVLKPAP